MDFTTETPETLVAQAQALIDTVLSELAASEDVLRTNGIDPEKLRKTMENCLNDHGRAQAQQAFLQDLQAVEQEVREQHMRPSLDSRMTHGGRVRNLRQLI